jgi:acyl carrier protein
VQFAFISGSICGSAAQEAGQCPRRRMERQRCSGYSMETTLTELADGVRAMLLLEDIDFDMPLSQIGIDSLNVVEMIILCQQVYVNVINYDDIHIDENTTLREIDQQMTDLSVS